MRRLLPFTAGLLAATAWTSGHAAETKAEQQANPQAETQALYAEIQKLQQRIATLEQQCPTAAASGPQPPASGSGPRYLSLKAWKRLEAGMEAEDVRAILGRPRSITRSGELVEVWSYGDSSLNPYATGTVYFDDDREVTTWLTPEFKGN